MSLDQPQFAIHVRYRGTSTGRAELVRSVARAFATQPGIVGCDIVGPEDIAIQCVDAESGMRVVMAFLADGDWAQAIALPSCRPPLVAAAAEAVGSRAGDIRVTSGPAIVDRELSGDIVAAFKLIGYVLHRRTAEGREATALMRRGMNQSEVAEALGVSKQAVSQRLAAAGWSSEQAGWSLAVHLLERSVALAEASQQK